MLWHIIYNYNIYEIWITTIISMKFGLLYEIWITNHVCGWNMSSIIYWVHWPRPHLSNQRKCTQKRPTCREHYSANGTS